MTPDTPEKAKKRKRDVELPRITYTAASRTFDRLFKEDSLDSMKDVVRKKLGLSAAIPVYLSQIRDGKSVDLDDDDDFEAFHSSAFSAVSTKVQVVLGEGSSSIAGNQTEPISQSSRKKKRKKRNSNAFAVDSSNAEPSDKDAHPSKIRRVAFAEQSSDPTTTPYKLTGKNAQKDSRTDVHDASPETGQPTKKSIPPSDRVSGVTTIEGSEVILEKEKRKKKKKDRLPTEDSTASQIPNLASLTRTSDATETTQDADAQRTTTDEPVRPAKKSTKRKRSESPPSRATEQTNTESSKLPTSTFNNGSQDSRAPKKPKKKSSNLLDEIPAGLPVPEQSTTASPNPPTQSSSQPPTKQKSRKKEKAAVDSAEKSVDSQPSDSSHHKSDGITGPKKSKQAMRKSEAQPPDQTLSSTTKAVSPSHQERQAEESRLPEPAKPKGKSKKIEDPPRRSPKISDPNVIVQEGSGEKQSEKEAAPTTAPQDYPAPTKTPKKTTKKKVEHPKAIDISQPSPDDAPKEKIDAPQKADAIDVGVKEVTRAAVQAILARNSAQSKPTIQVTTTPTPPVTTAPEKPPRPSDSADPAPTQPTQVTEKSSQPKATKDKEKTETAKCDVCGESPPHPRSKCPIIKAGIRSMRRRMVELQELTSGGDDHSEVIAELERLIEKKTRKPRISAVLKPDAPALDETNLPTANHVNDTPVQSTSKQSSTQSLHPKLTTLLAPSSQLPASQPPAFQLPAPQLPAPQLPAPQTPRRSPSPHPPPSAQPSKSAPSAEHTTRNPKKPSMTHSKGLSLNDISQGTTFLGFGDVSGYSEKDLRELVRGPKVSLANVPFSDTSEDENEQEEAALENDSVEAELPRNLSQMGYPDSSDESDNEDDDESPRASISPKLPLIKSGTVRLGSGPEASSTADGTERANRSFQEVEALGSSRELDRTGDIAVNSIVDDDIALISPSKASQDRHNGGYVSSDTSASSKGPVTRPKSPEISQVSTAIEKGQELDPIEPSENPQASQPELIVSDDGFTPVESTPKEKVAVRTRSQRNKAAAPIPTPASTQEGPSQELVNGANEPSKPTRKTRSLTKISELPIPPNPSVRIIRPPLASTTLIRTRRQMAQEESQEPEAPEPSPAKGKNAPAVKTTAKPLSKAVAKPTTKPLVILPPKTVANRKVPSSAKSILANGIHTGKTRGSKAAVVSASPPKDTEPNTTMENGENPVTSWVTLQEGQAPQVDAETPGMLDELLSSPTPASSLTKGQKADVNGSSPVPLFVHTDSQQSFPYSQYPDLSSKVRAASPNDSEDEEEVAATVVKPATKSAMFRSLTEIASQPLFKSRRQSSQFVNRTEAPVTDYYGPSAGQEESDDSGSDSDSEAEGKKVASHIPASRRAGVAVSKRK